MSFETNVIREGKTVSEAVQKGLRSLSIKEDQANIKVLSKGRKGFLGIGSKPARVQVAIKDEIVAELKLKNILVDLDLNQNIGASCPVPTATEAATAEVAAAGVAVAAMPEPAQAERASGETGSVGEEAAGEPEEKRPGSAAVRDGKLTVTDPTGGDRYATVIPDKTVRLTVNGSIVERETRVTGEDEISIDIINDEPVVSMEMTVSRDKMEAYLRLVRLPGATYRLKDQEAAGQLTLITEVEQIVDPPAVTDDDVRRFLQEKGVTRGLLGEGIEQVLNNPNTREDFIVARGQEPVHGIDAKISYPFMENKDDNEDKGPFDFDKLVSVNPGDAVAVRIPKVEGEDGWTVTGETLPAKVPEECEISVKNGCELTEGGTQAIAAISGRPVVEESGSKVCVYIDPILIVPEVNQATGNIDFSGDVEVKGDVRDGCRIEANGNVQVMGDVSRATITAGASVVLHKNVLASTVVAGGRSALYSSVRSHFEEINEMIKRLYETASQQKAGIPGGACEDDGPLIQRLIDEGFRYIPVVAGKLFDMAPAMGRLAHEEVLDHIYLLYTSFGGLGPLRISSLGALHEILVATGDVINLIDCSLLRTDSIKVRYVQNSALVSSGDIIIEGQGAYISSLNAAGRVIIAGKPGIARGVKVTAGGTVEIKDLGSEFETQTYVKTKKEGKILAELIYSDVVVQVGNEKFRVDKASRNFAAYLDPEGNLVVDRLTAEEKKQEK